MPSNIINLMDNDQTFKDLLMLTEFTALRNISEVKMRVGLMSMRGKEL